MNYTDLTTIMVGFIGFVASLVQLYDFVSRPTFQYYLDLAILKKSSLLT